MTGSRPKTLVKSEAASSEDDVPTKLDLTDHNGIRRALQEHAEQAAIAAGFQPARGAENLRMLLGFLMVAIVGLAHLLPGKFPAHKNELRMCVAGYYILAALSFVVNAVLIQDAFLVTKSGSPSQGTPSLSLRLDMGRYSPEFKLRIKAAGKVHDTEQQSITSYFHADGYLAEDKYHAWVSAALQDAIAGHSKEE